MEEAEEIAKDVHGTENIKMMTNFVWLSKRVTFDELYWYNMGCYSEPNGECVECFGTKVRCFDCKLKIKCIEFPPDTDIWNLGLAKMKELNSLYVREVLRR